MDGRKCWGRWCNQYNVDITCYNTVIEIDIKGVEGLDYSICDQLPKDWEAQPPDINVIPRGVCIAICDAGYKNGIAGISTSIRTSEKEYKPRECPKRGKGPVHAELVAIYTTINRVLSIRRPIKVCIIYTDSLNAYHFVEDGWVPRLIYIKEIRDRIRTGINKLNNRGVKVIVRQTCSKNIRRVDKRADKMRKIAEEKKEKQISERIKEVEKAITRSREITIYENNGECFAMPKEKGFPPGYKVSISPLSCECPWWRNRWGKQEQRVIHARALPCKHICALLEYLGRDICQFFTLQIKRVD